MKLPKLFCKNNRDFKANILNHFDSDIYSEYDGLHPGKLFIKLFQSFYSVFDISTDISIDEGKFIEGLKRKYKLSDDQIFRSDITSNNSKDKSITEFSNYRAFIIIKNCLAVWIKYHEISILYNSTIPKEDVLEIAGFTEQFKKPEEEKKEFHMLVRDFKEYKLRDFEIKKYDIDIDRNYNDDFKNIHELITGTLNDKKENGIILLHGSYGSGKTYYIRHLISAVNRKFIYLPLNMVGSISDPEFIPFMAKFKDCVLVLEDCEKLLMHRDDGNPNATALSNLLNLGDGLLSDAFSINVLCTFNANLQKIDDALLRKGRLIARYEFKELEIPKAQQLADKLEKNITVEKPMTLTDIYNAESMKFENKKVGKIGFAYA